MRSPSAVNSAQKAVPGSPVFLILNVCCIFGLLLLEQASIQENTLK